MIGHIGIKTHHKEHAATVKQGAIFSPQNDSLKCSVWDLQEKLN